MPEDIPPELEHRFREYIRVLISYIDFQQAGSIANRIIELKLHEKRPRDRFLLQGLNTGMVVAYCRPFVGGNSRRRKNLPTLPSRYVKLLSPEQREIHETVLDDRNTALAHSDDEAWNMRPTIVRLPAGDIVVPLSHDAHAPLTFDATKQFEEMCSKLREACFEQRMKLEPTFKPYFQVQEVPENILEAAEYARRTIKP